MVERPLSMREVSGSLPGFSNSTLESFNLSVFFVVKTMIFPVGHLLLKCCFLIFLIPFSVGFVFFPSSYFFVRSLG